MKYLFLLLLGVCVSCAGRYDGVSEKYHNLLDQALVKAQDNQQELLTALSKVDKSEKDGMAFLIAYMPERDLRTLKSAFLIQQVDLAYQARNAHEWSKAIPEDLFLNDVLPYVILNETREDWRSDFYTRFSKYVDTCSTLESAIVCVNSNIENELKVEYNTKRRKPDQSPKESMEQLMASCSGLSILLVDAFRSVGIPARVAGTANWHDNRGNHNWCEVWKDGAWYFTEYYYNALNKAWFLADAGRAKVNDRTYSIYASSYKPTGILFPLVWDETIDYVYAEEVSQRYIDIYTQTMKDLIENPNYVKLSVSMFGSLKSHYDSKDRVAVNLDLFEGPSQLGGGRTADSTKDMNDCLSFYVEKNKSYLIKYADKAGELVEKTVDVKDKDEQVNIVFE